MWISIGPITICWKDIFYTLNFPVKMVKNQLIINKWIYWLSILFCWSFIHLMQIQYCLDYYSFVVCFKIRKHESSKMAVIFQVCYLLWVPFIIIQILGILVNFCPKNSRDFDQDFIELLVTYCRVVHHLDSIAYEVFQYINMKYLLGLLFFNNGLQFAFHESASHLCSIYSFCFWWKCKWNFPNLIFSWSLLVYRNIIDSLWKHNWFLYQFLLYTLLNLLGLKFILRIIYDFYIISSHW